MKLVVDQEFIETYKRVVMFYARHTNACNYHNVEVCDCGYSDYIKKLQELANNVKPVHQEVVFQG